MRIRGRKRCHAGDGAALLALLSALALTAGCESAGARSRFDLESLPPLSAREELRIGSSNDPDFGFSRVYSVEVDPEGRVYALELVDRQIRVYSSDGRTLLHRIGGPGEGPGEFMSASRFGVVGDTVWVYDNRLGRITLFDREGTLLSTGHTLGVRVPLWNCFGYALPWHMRPDGLFTGEMTRMACSRDDPASGIQPTDSVPVPRILFDATGTVVDTVGWDESPPPRLARPPGAYEEIGLETVTVSTGRYIVPTPQPEMPYWVGLVDGWIMIDMTMAETAEDATFRVTRRGANRDTIYSRALRYRPLRYSSEFLDAIALDAARDGPLTAGGVELDEGAITVAAHELRAAMQYPAFHPPIQSYHIGKDASVWLSLSGEDPDTRRWAILDPNGSPLGELVLPADVRPAWSEGDVFWAIEPDDLDLPWLVKYRISG